MQKDISSLINKGIKRPPRRERKLSFKLGDKVKYSFVNWSKGTYRDLFGIVIQLYDTNIKIEVEDKKTIIISRYSPFLHKYKI